MAKCFVMQPFDRGKYDKRYQDVYKPAIEMVGLEAYRVDNDPSVEIPIQSIEDGIRGASICIADITEDNPNVWFEVGFALSAGKHIILMCSEDRLGQFPFDVRHRIIISYKTESTSDFDKLKADLTKRLETLMKAEDTNRELVTLRPEQLIAGLKPHEISALVSILTVASYPEDSISSTVIIESMDKVGFTRAACMVALRDLQQKGFLESEEFNFGNILYRVTDAGWEWISRNLDQVQLTKSFPAKSSDEKTS